MPRRAILLRVLFGSLAVAAVCGAAGILLASYDTVWRVAGTAILTAVAALLLLAASRFVDRDRAPLRDGDVRASRRRIGARGRMRHARAGRARAA